MKFKLDLLKDFLPIVLVFAASSQLLMSQQQSVDASLSSGAVPSSPGMDSDAFDFQADLYTGRFTYSVPIVVPPGRQGAQPKLALGYNSSGAVGWCGVGWSLEVGFIQRDTRKGVPIAWGSSNALPSYDDSKGFVANNGGAMTTLVRVGLTNVNPIVYHQQVDSKFLTYNYYTNNHWEIVDKSGNTFYFGEGITNQMENNKSNWVSGVGASTFRWALDKVIDANGNETFLSYTTDRGKLYLTNIIYNANTNIPTMPASDVVSFVLTNRTDTNITFMSGYRVETQKILSEIDIYANGNNVRKYVLGYSNSFSTLRSLLSSVTQYGSDFNTALPPISFNYQVKPFAFSAETNWTGLSSPETNAEWDGITYENSDSAFPVIMTDVDGDGLPDRVTQMPPGQPAYNYFVIQRNTGTNFATPVTNYTWANVISQGALDRDWNAPSWRDGTNTTVEFFDINGDGYPDRVMRKISSPYTNWSVQLNTGFQGTNGFANDTNWQPLLSEAGSNSEAYASTESSFALNTIDINGDGLPDRVMAKLTAPFDRFKVQLNTGTGFTPLLDWGTLDSQGQTGVGWNSPSHLDGNYADFEVMLVDINGDGLPDRVMRDVNPPYTNFWVQFNNGAGFEPAEPWGTLSSQGQTNNPDWSSPLGTDGQYVWSTLVDINGDGLPDRVMRVLNPPYTNWVVQLNTGSSFGPVVNFGPLDSQGLTSGDENDISAEDGNGVTYIDFFDINGDGLPDRVMRGTNGGFDHLAVQLNLGPFPDLLNVVSNGLGGSLQVSYVASTTLDNRNTNWISDPWAEGTKSLLPFNTWVVSQIISSDGMGNAGTNNYAFKGGYYNVPEREFRGFSQATVVDPTGKKTTTYFHQSGGRDNSALGEYADQGTESKKGLPYRIEVVGNDGATNKITLNKVQEVVLNTNGWYFPFVAQTIEMTYEGLSSYRATAKQFSYDTNTENLIATATLGEVTNVVVVGQTFTDVGSDSLYTWITYDTSLGSILNKPTDVKITSDSDGSVRLRESLSGYDAKGRLTSSQVWLDTASSYITTAINVYDAYGNAISSTDAAGITSSNIYDSTFEQFPVTVITGTFTNTATYDIGSGITLTSTDAKGLVSSNVMDVFDRTTATFISTNAYGPESLWQTRVFYSLGGIVSGVSSNFVHKQVNDAVDLVNGHETFLYSDGLGRSIETRTEAETGQYRVANTAYDQAGRPYFQTLNYFSSGTAYTVPSGTLLGTLTEYDDVGRPFRVTSSEQAVFVSGQVSSISATAGDSGSPVGATTTAFVDGSNPWAKVMTDAAGNVKKYYSDAYTRTITITEVTTNGNYNTHFYFDLLGNLTNEVDNAGNPISMAYDSLGREISIIHSDIGTASFVYDNSSRIIQQTDARGNVIKLYYVDPIGRLTSKQIYNGSSQLVGTVSYIYDVSDDPGYTVLKGQLYKTVDLQGYSRSSYDVRGRVLKSGRFLNLNGMEYVTQSTYDDADRISQLTYPGGGVTLQYTYDTAGNISTVQSLAGTGTNDEIFYSPQAFNELGQMTWYTNGNGVITTNVFYANSKRLLKSQVYKGTNSLQNLSYTYDLVSNIKSINDQVYTGTASATITNLNYDQLNRLTLVGSVARGVKSYAYDSIGNVTTNQDNGPSQYVYGAQPHAVTNANGTRYAYDACGNMTTRGSQSLVYDEQNQLKLVSATNMAVMFGYDDSGERLWRNGTNGYTIWIGGIYEINSGKVLCHVVADGALIATFEPQCNAVMSGIFGEKRWFAAATVMDRVMDWPFQKGRSFYTVFTGTLLGMLLLVWRACQGIRLTKRQVRQTFCSHSLWRQAVTLLTIGLFLASGIRDAEAATYNPVFYYYHVNNVGSSNVLTDRSGSLVQHYEYSSYGNQTFTDNTSAFAVSNRFTGQIADDETGLYYYGSRYYDPQLGRFIQPDDEVPDPSDPQSFNLYTYCGNNPMIYVDPTGHDLSLGGDIGLGDGIESLFGGSDGDGSFFGAFAASGGGNPVASTGFGGALSDQSSIVSSISNETFTSDIGQANLEDVNSSIGKFTGNNLEGWVFNGTSQFSVSTDSYQSHEYTPDVTTASSASGFSSWVGPITNAAGLLAMAPPPVGPIAGGINVVGLAMQGRTGEAAFASIVMVAGIFGGGIVAKMVQEGGFLKAANTEARFIVSEGGTVVHASQTEMISSLEGAGLTGTPTQSAGMAYELPNGVTARAMEPAGPNTWRTSFNNTSGTRVTPEGVVPQPPRGLTAAEQKVWLNQQTHISQRP